MSNAENLQKILVVDDEAGIRNGLKLSLEQLGFEVQVAESGEQALYQLKQNPNSISQIISDFKMPGLNGMEVLKEAKKLNSRARFVMMTGFGSVSHAVVAMQAGADDYLCKPFQFEELERIVTKPLVSG